MGDQRCKIATSVCSRQNVHAETLANNPWTGFPLGIPFRDYFCNRHQARREVRARCLRPNIPQPSHEWRNFIVEGTLFRLIPCALSLSVIMYFPFSPQVSYQVHATLFPRYQWWMNALDFNLVPLGHGVCVGLDSAYHFFSNRIDCNV